VVELNSSDSDACSDTELELDKGNDKGKHIIDVEPSATVATSKVQKIEPEDLEEGEHLFHSQKWVKGSPLQFIGDNRSQNNLSSVKVIKWMGLRTTPHP